MCIHLQETLFILLTCYHFFYCPSITMNHFSFYAECHVSAYFISLESAFHFIIQCYVLYHLQSSKFWPGCTSYYQKEWGPTSTSMEYHIVLPYSVEKYKPLLFCVFPKILKFLLLGHLICLPANFSETVILTISSSC